jgi:hypothetical protein
MQRRGLTRFRLGEVDLMYQWESWADVQIIADFFESVRGGAARFTFVDRNGIDEGGRAWAKLFVAQGDGAEDGPWDLPTYALVASPAPIVYEDGVAKTTTWDTTTPAAGTYGIKAGTGTDGLDRLYAGTAPAAAVIVTISGTCRRAFRKALFLDEKNPFAWATPDNYSCGPVTIIEVRK